jgi:hypothetical protein
MRLATGSPSGNAFPNMVCLQVFPAERGRHHVQFLLELHDRDAEVAGSPRSADLSRGDNRAGGTSRTDAFAHAEADVLMRLIACRDFGHKVQHEPSLHQRVEYAQDLIRSTIDTPVLQSAARAAYGVFCPEHPEEYLDLDIWMFVAKERAADLRAQPQFAVVRASIEADLKEIVKHPRPRDASEEDFHQAIQRLKAETGETSARAAPARASTPMATPSEAAAAGGQQDSPKPLASTATATFVRFHGLQSQPALNGRIGEVAAEINPHPEHC